MNDSTTWGRRSFLATLAAAGGMLALQSAQGQEAKEVVKPKLNKKIKLGFDNFSIRAFGWKAPQLIEYAEKVKVDTILLSDLDVYESYEEDYLKKVKALADEKGIELQVGTGSICPTSNSFNKKYGTVDELLALLIRVAKTLGSPVARCYLGNGRDRLDEGGIYKHIDTTVQVLRKIRPQAEKAGVKFAVENHAGDMQAWELVELIEGAGKDFVGATLDSGNAAWTIEHPMVNLEILGPYTLTTGIRDNMVHEIPTGAAVAWTAMGDGQTDWTKYVERFAELCPGVSFQLEIIAGIWNREMPYLQDDFWKAFPRARAAEFAQYIKFAKEGRPYQPPADRPTGERSAELEQKQQAYDLERSIAFCKNQLGLGVRS